MLFRANNVQLCAVSLLCYSFTSRMLYYNMHDPETCEFVFIVANVWPLEIVFIVCVCFMHQVVLIGCCCILTWLDLLAQLRLQRALN